MKHTKKWPKVVGITLVVLGIIGAIMILFQVLPVLHYVTSAGNVQFKLYAAERALSFATKIGLIVAGVLLSRRHRFAPALFVALFVTSAVDSFIVSRWLPPVVDLAGVERAGREFGRFLGAVAPPAVYFTLAIVLWRNRSRPDSDETEKGQTEKGSLLKPS
jgi:hypothetical protein